MLLESTGEFLDAGLQKSGNEFWESADDSTASDEIRWSEVLKWWQMVFPPLVAVSEHDLSSLDGQ